MAGINAQQVYLPSPDQSKTAGAISVAALGTEVPTDARTALGSGFESGGYVSENGISLGVSRSTQAIKDWSMATVRKALTDFDGTISLEFLQVDKFAADRILGSANVTTTAKTRDHGNQLGMKIGPAMAEAEAWVFSMKDGERRVRVVVPNGQITELPSDVSFVPGAANIWPATLSCYDDGNGYSIYVYYDDGEMLAA